MAVTDRLHVVREDASRTDAALLAAVARGDREAYATLHDRHAPTILGVLCRMLGSRPEAEDLLQEVFLHVWKQAGTFDEARGRAVQWLITLARSRALDRLGVLHARRRLLALRLHAEPDADVAADPADEASLAEEGRRLRHALAQIPDAQRRVLLLAYFDGLSHSQIARCLGTPLGTVKSNARLGLTKLRALLRAHPIGLP